MGYLARSGASLIRIRGERSLSLFGALGYKQDEDLSAEDNLIECLIDLDWECVERADDIFGFSHDRDEAMDWQAFVNMVPFLEDGSFFEERPDEFKRVSIELKRSMLQLQVRIEADIFMLAILRCRGCAADCPWFSCKSASGYLRLDFFRQRLAQVRSL